MNEHDKHKQAEDILTDEAFDGSVRGHQAPGDGPVTDQLALAQAIRHAVASRRAEFDAAEKLDLAGRISASIESEKRSRKLVWLGAAAALVLAAVFSVVVIGMRQSELRQFGSKMATIDAGTNTRLMLTPQQNIEISDNESAIAYDAGSRAVTIEESGTTRQANLTDAGRYNTLLVPYGKRSRIKLSDNTVVWLNSGSRLVYPVTFGKKQREVYLSGEALFEVDHQPERPFVVMTGRMDVKVLGTTFNLSAYDDDSLVSTVLVQGSVELIHRSMVPGMRKSGKIVPGTCAEYDARRNTLSRSVVDPALYTSWKDGYFVFEKRTLSEISKKLARYYAVRIEFEDKKLADETFSGRLDLKPSGMEVLQMIAEINGAAVVDDGGTLRLVRRN